MALAVGIDLGTTNTVLAAVRDGVAATVCDPQGNRLIPSVVSFHPSGSTLVGHAALERRLLDAANTIYSIKRLLGRAWVSPEVQQAVPRLPFSLSEGATGGTVVTARGETYSLPEISAFVLRHAKAIAEAALGEPVERAVVTVPANFNDLQRAATKAAGRIAGLEVLRILNEPTAAALAYGPPEKPQERIAVYDLGGGTFDVTILDLAGNVFEVLSTAGDTALGGDDIDLVVAERMADDLLAKHRYDARSQPAAFGQLRVLAERMKRDLSASDEQTAAADDLVPGHRGARVPWRFSMTRAELEQASLAIVERTFVVCQRALEATGMQVRDLDRVILVGGATRMPLVERKVEQFFGRPPVVRINPDEVVALGAAIQASLLDRSRPRAAQPPAHPRISEDSVVQLAPGAASGEEPPAPADLLGLPLVMPEAAPAAAARRAPPPPPPAAKRTLRFDQPPTLPGAPLPPVRPRAPTMPFPFEASAAPAIQPMTMPEPEPPPRPPSLRAAPPLSPPPPPRPAPLLIDVTPLSLGVETAGGYCDVLIEANTPVPCDRTRAFATATDGQTTVTVRVAQGPNKRFAENTCLGELELSGIAPAPRGETQIAVTFEIDADGILNVRARDLKTGQETAARMQLAGQQPGAGSDDVELEAMRARQAAHPIG